MKIRIIITLIIFVSATKYCFGSKFEGEKIFRQQHQFEELDAQLDLLYEMREEAKENLKSMSPEQADNYMKDYLDGSSIIIDKINHEIIPYDDPSPLKDYMYIEQGNNTHYKVEVDYYIVKIAKKCKKVGLKVIHIGEGIYIFNLPNSYYKDLFYSYITQEYKEFLSLLEAEGDEPIIQDAYITNVRRLGDLIYKCEDFISNYPNSKRAEIVKESYNSYRLVYLTGISNSPILADNNKLDPEIRFEFQRFIRKYPYSPTVFYIKQILEKDGHESINKTLESIRDKFNPDGYY